MSLFDDDRPKKPGIHEIGSDITLLSVDELKERISRLHEEIARLELACNEKASGRKAAESLFRS
ncbi:DUF1192 domain-containing protein [Rhizobium sp. VS19-DR104.2]|uniref:DUF1192 domain-containing protein n=1 Tax=unclassified Rhizobium TaxID=2613769 RepID=UPI001C5AA868|nr:MULTISPECIES: DUF1192 domain-containing protein [unclassified Rhizobium]MBZ5759027.1 DUF1192 domain-containing protein [Rhizobium sp. VS19-DR96]MBZ5764143.1 DUF1192 domain-containing protein [Rhizobium sp. VS19-DR129.2]MBZ5771686.1 DUF1192 domain-containing protein [Rhizobium sp. VS19-DRK62.2]MBZ5783627.1 DUF1192 domain-containing protein [Rhizobium sp. VS19-DR121]MBZ5801699.1 DUF1192 domain-containing protein [Rhizobium sp. VS19-DR181]